MKYIRTTEKVGASASLKFKEIKVLGDRRRAIAKLCAGKRVLVIGCVDMMEIISLNEFVSSGDHQFYNISKVAEKAVGIDINDDGVKALKEQGMVAEACDIMGGICDCFDEDYDIVVVSHVIEHVLDMYGFIKKIQQKIKFKEMILAVPNAYNTRSVIPSILLRREQVSNDHYYAFTPVTFLKFVQGLGMEVKELYFDSCWVRKGRDHPVLGLIWSFVVAVFSRHSGNIIVIARNKSHEESC